MTIDMSKIDAMKEAMGEDFKLLIPAVLDDAERILTSLPGCIAEEKIDEVERLAHSLKSVALNVGATRLSDMAKGLEASSRGGSLDGADGVTQEMLNEFEVVKQALAAL